MHSDKFPSKFSLFFLKVIYPYRAYVLGLFSIGIYTSFHNSIQPYILKMLINASIATLGKENFISSCVDYAVILIGMSILLVTLWRMYNYFQLKFIPLLKSDVINLTTRYLRQQSYQFYQDNLSGSVSAKVGDLSNNTCDLINNSVNFFRQGLTLILSIGVAWSVHQYFALFFFFWTIGFMALAYYCAKSLQPYAERYAESRSKNFGVIVDCFANAPSMLVFARQKYEDLYLQGSLSEAIANEKAMYWKNLLNASILGGMSSLMVILSIILLLILGDKGLLTAGDFVLIFMLALNISEQIWDFIANFDSCAQQIGVCQQALNLMSAEQSQPNQINTKSLIVDKGTIVFHRVYFKYGEGEHFFQNKTLAIFGGQKIGLVGYSGSGKSTFVNLITRLYDVQSGKILIDDQNIQDVSIETLRMNISYIPQDPGLFHRSIIENIRYGKTEATDDEVIDAAIKAHADEFIRDTSEGYNTLVGERGIKLSGGQRQRIAIARAILKNAPILILDEATSALDSITEQLIQKSLDYAMKNKTVIVIAHRLSTLLSMDRILVFDQGRIIEEGSHDELIAAQGFYKKLWDVQKGHNYVG